MKKLDFNHGWTVRCLTREEPAKTVNLPHDAMISEPRTEDSLGEGNIGWYIGGDYEYTRKFIPGAALRGKKLLLEFEGVYMNPEVYVNGELAGFRAYGYTNFYVDLTNLIRFEAENEIRVVARNSEQPNSRWYSGTGIYRPVILWVGEAEYIPVNGVRIRTLSIDPARIQIRVKTSQPGEVKVQILESGRTVAAASALAGSAAPYAPVPAVFGQSAKTASPAQQCDFEAGLEITIPEAELWSPEHPNLYTCRVTFGQDTDEEVFGIRTLHWDPEDGLTINGKRVILRGACIHHSDGVLGAAVYPEAEARRVRILLENGYNAIRSAHNPCSKALLEACDRLGMLMMDEFADCWYIHKTRHDYAEHLEEWWQDDLREMVEKDYNHPCVIMYSTGNEVAETSQPRGIAFTKEMTEYLHRLDGTRPVTCGINIFFNYLFSMGLGVYSDEKADAAAKKAENPKKGRKKHVGSDFYNTLAMKVGDNFMKIGATLHGSNVKTRDAFANMDIAGYNYGLYRYRGDLKKYPTRLILGSETFCKDAYSFYEIAKQEKRIIGDFVWAGFDYIGECGEGGPEYQAYNFNDESPATAMTGACGGRMDLTGRPKAEAAYTRVALEREMGPYIAVEPVCFQDRIQISGWQLTKALESWSWEGCDGQPAKILVFARGKEAELLINGTSVGKKKLKKAKAVFRTTYAGGEITTVSYGDDGQEIGRYTLKTAGKETLMRAAPEAPTAKPEGLIFLPIRYTDGEGVWKPMERHQLRVSVENGTLLGLGNGCPYYRGNYTDPTTETYFGDAFAVVQAGTEGAVRITVSDEKRDVPVIVPIQA